jgi:hypothetical protein
MDLGNGVFERVDENGEAIGVAVLTVSERNERELPFAVILQKRSEA